MVAEPVFRVQLIIAREAEDWMLKRVQHDDMRALLLGEPA